MKPLIIGEKKFTCELLIADDKWFHVVAFTISLTPEYCNANASPRGNRKFHVHTIGKDYRMYLWMLHTIVKMSFKHP